MRVMIARPDFLSLFVSYFISNSLEQKDPPISLALAFFLAKEILISRNDQYNYAFGQKRFDQNFSKRTLRHSSSFYRVVVTAPIAKSLASHMSSKGKSQSGAIKIGASVNFLLSVLKDSIHSSEKKNGVSFSHLKRGSGSQFDTAHGYAVSSLMDTAYWSSE
ncbi:hypothetical protein Tco_0237833 [Tanacetum coccineum]